MFRLSSFLLLLVILWQIVGFGFVVSVAEHNFGVITKASNEETRGSFSLPIPAFLMSSEAAAEYESVTFVGDVLLARNVEFLMREKSVNYPFNGLDLSSLNLSSAVIGNFEAAIPAEHTPTPIGMIDFSVATENITGLTKAGFTHMSLANNHSFDFGSADLSNTQEKLSGEVSVFGHPKEVTDEYFEIIEVSNQRVALIGINALHEVNDKELEKTLKQASAKSDFQIIYIHWGEEYALRHSEGQESLAKKLVQRGADLIVGHHPHVVQGIDLIDNVPVFYSLGNYVFDQYFSKDVQEGLVVSLTLNEEMGISLLPVTSKEVLSQPQPMTSENHARFLEQLARKSHPDLQDDITKGLISIDVNIASSPKVAIMHDTKRYVQ